MTVSFSVPLSFRFEKLFLHLSQLLQSVFFSILLDVLFVGPEYLLSLDWSDGALRERERVCVCVCVCENKKKTKKKKKSRVCVRVLGSNSGFDRQLRDDVPAGLFLRQLWFRGSRPAPCDKAKSVHLTGRQMIWLFDWHLHAHASAQSCTFSCGSIGCHLPRK